MKITLKGWRSIPAPMMGAGVAGLLLLGIGANAQAVETDDPTLDVSGFVENATYVRHRRGLSKFRNTAQLEVSKDLGEVGAFNGGVSFNGTFRATYDGVYDLNDDEFGDSAGGPVQIEDVGGPTGSVPHGQGLGSTDPASPYFGVPLPPGNTFGFNAATNPNDGLVVLGEELHRTGGGVAFGVPVRPCDVDSRGCIGGYMDADEDELKHPEFNDRWDFIREAYIDANMGLDSGTYFNLKVGKQQVVWGRTDLFRVLDVINPVDFSRNNIYDELEDIRIPLWTAAAEWQFGATEIFDDINFQLVWVFDKFRPNNLGQGGQPNAILDAGSFFRGMNNCWENGCTVSNFAGGVTATDFGPGVIGIRKAHMPEWSLENTQFGGKLEGVYKDIGFSFNALYFRSQLPSLRGGIPATNLFTGATGNWPYLIAFDIHFPRVFLLGGSLDAYVDSIKTAIRVEAAWTTGEEFANSLQPRLFSESDVFRWVIGLDRNVFIRPLNQNRAFLFSFQTFGQHILEHEREDGLFGEVGMPDWEDNYISTLLIKGWWQNDRVSPQIITAWDWGAQAGAIEPKVEWLVDDNWKVTFGANIKFGSDGARKFSDCRTCNPFGPFTAAGHVPATAAYDTGLGGYEPLGRFQAGPIGMSRNEDELQLTVRYRF